MQLNGGNSMSGQGIGQFSTDAIARLESNRLDWQHLTGSPQFDYPIDYSVAVTSVDRAAGVIEFIAKWAPNSYCHYHRDLPMPGRQRKSVRHRRQGWDCARHRDCRRFCIRTVTLRPVAMIQ